MSSELLLKELHTRFDEVRRAFSLQVSLSDLGKAFFIEDAVLSAGYVSPDLLQQLCSRISEVFMNWNTYLHGLVMPDPHNLIQMNESKLLSSEQKKMALSLMTQAMKLVSRNSLFHVNPDPTAQARFIDESFSFWITMYQPSLSVLVTRVFNGWNT